MTQQVKIIPFKPYHLLLLDIQEEQKHFLNLFTDAASILEYGNYILESALINHNRERCCWTALLEGKVIMCGGIIGMQLHVGEMWALVGSNLKKHIRRILPKIRKVLTETRLLRIYVLIDEGFNKADKLAEFLGFEYEGTLRKNGTNRMDQKMYSIIKEDM